MLSFAVSDFFLLSNTPVPSDAFSASSGDVQSGAQRPSGLTSHFSRKVSYVRLCSLSDLLSTARGVEDNTWLIFKVPRYSLQKSERRVTPPSSSSASPSPFLDVACPWRSSRVRSG